MKKLFTLFFLLSLNFLSFGAYLENVPTQLVQPNGEVLNLFITGDEFYRRVHDSEGYSIVQGSDGWYYYALYDAEKDELVPSSYLVTTSQNIELTMAKGLTISHEKYMERRRAYFEPTGCTPSGAAKNSILKDLADAKSTQQMNNIVICIGFSDTEGMSNSFSFVNGMFNTNAGNNMRDYFSTMSYGKLDLVSSFYPPANGDLLRFYKDSQPRNYYRPYHATTNPIGYQNGNEETSREHALLRNAVNWVNANWPVSTSLNLDINNDGHCDFISFVVYGTTGEWNELLWPHKWSLYSSPAVYLNGKRVYDYNFELDGNPTYFNSNVFCHEGYHVLSAPDLYHYYDYTDIRACYSWDIMDYSYLTKPQSMSAYMKYEYGNWVTSLPTATLNKTYELFPFYNYDGSNPDKQVMFKIPMTGTSSQYSVVEYRKKAGTNYDYYLPNEGFLIYRIDSYMSGNSNFNGTYLFDEIYLYRPGSSQTGGVYTQGNFNEAPFNSINNRTAFNSTTNPKPCQSDGTAENMQDINNILYDSETDSYTFFYGNPVNRQISLGKITLALAQATGSTGTVTVTSNVLWRVTIPEGATSWLSASITKGLNDGTVILTALSENASGTDRIAHVTITGNNETFIVTVTQSSDEVIEEPFGLKVDVNGTDALFSWNNEIFLDNMEGYNNFIINNIGDYILYDGDGSSTYPISGSVFPNQAYKGSYIVFNPSQVSPPMTAPEIQPHSGNKFLACFSATQSANNDWLILPKQRINTGTVFKFWAKRYPNQFGADRFKVGVSTTGTLPANFTIISSGNYVEAPLSWTEYSYNLDAYAGSDAHVAIACVSNDAFIFMVDDIFLGIPGKGSSNPSGKSFSGYTVYLDGSPKATGLQNTEYLFTNLSEGMHTAGVQAIFTTGSSNIITKNFFVGSGCPAPTNLGVTYTSDCAAELTWNAPPQKLIVLKPTQEEEAIEEQMSLQTDVRFSSFNTHNNKIAHSAPLEKSAHWLSWCNVNEDAVGTGEPVDFIAAARFTPADLAAASIVNGDVISKIRFFVYNTEGITFTIQIYQGGNSPANPGSLMYQQTITQPLISEAYNEVALTTPYLINSTQELWIAYRLQITEFGQFPAGCDAGPRVINKGDLIYSYGTWSNLLEVAEVEANWNLEALIGLETTYNIYRNGFLIASNITGTSYHDEGFSPHEGYTWSVRAVCPAGGVSAPVSSTLTACQPVYTITASAGTHGAIFPTGAVTVIHGENKTFYFYPESGYEINTVLVNGVNNTGAVASGNYTFTNVTGNHTISVTFKEIFVPVTNITNVPAVATVGVSLPLTGTVIPSNATNKTIVWSMVNAGSTGASITGSAFLATASGTAVVMATIANGTATGTNYTQQFNIIVNAGFVSVTNITNVPATATVTLPLTLTGTVVPNNATNQTIVWSVWNQGGSGATISGGNILNTTASGTAIIRATINNGSAAGTNYTQDFNIVVSKATLSGTLTINGNAVFGSLLTAITTALTSEPSGVSLGTLSYQWGRNGTPIAEATNPTYTLVQADIGSVLSVSVTAANCNGTVSANTVIVTKATQTPPDKPELDHATTHSITLKTMLNCEYRINGAASWQTSTTFDGLTPNTTYAFEARKVETDTHFPSEPSPSAQFATNVVATYTITATVNNPNFGTIEPLGETVVAEGGTVTYTITAYQNYEISDVLVNNLSQGRINTYTFEDVRANGAIAASFGVNGIGENEFRNVHVYSHSNSIYIKNETNVALKSVEIIDMFGRSIYQDTVTDIETVITLQVANGIYTVRLISEDENVSATKVLILR